MATVNDNNFVTIQGWMRTKLGLKGNELFVYALIYGFSQDGNSKFSGTRRYIAEWCGCSLKTVDNTIASLLAEKLIVKHEKYVNGIRMCDYTATPPETATRQNDMQNTPDEHAAVCRATDPQPLIQEPQPTEHRDKPDDIKEIVDHLNNKTGSHYKPTTGTTRKLIKARLKEGFTVEEIKLVIDKKAAEWLGNAAMEQYLRPETLFGNKFESYLNAKVTPQNGRYNTTSTYSPYCAPVTDDEEPSCSVGW